MKHIVWIINLTKKLCICHTTLRWCNGTVLPSVMASTLLLIPTSFDNKAPTPSLPKGIKKAVKKSLLTEVQHP